jgi:hypothetical protein
MPDRLVRRLRGQWWPPSALPLALAAFPTLRLSVESGVSIFGVVRGLAVALAAGLAIWVLAVALARDRGRATLLAVGAVFALLAWQSLPQLLLAAALVLVVTLVVPRLLGVSFPWGLVVRAGNALSLILLMALAIRGAQNGSLLQVGRDTVDAAAALRGPQIVAAPAGAPDIYILMLEDYPRADVLERLFGFDNRAFLSGLADRGFTVSAKSRSNYSTSALTLLTMFHARHIEDIPELQDLLLSGGNDVQPLLRRLTGSGVVFDILRRNGYVVHAASSGFEQLTLRSADRFFDSGHLNDVELAALRQTAIAPLIDAAAPAFLADQQRGRVLAELSDLSAVARNPTDRPKLVFVHLPSPHPPIVFGRHGESVEVSMIDPYEGQLHDVARFGQLYVDQLAYLNELVLDALDDLAEAPRPAVTIVMSDEGIGVAIVAATSRAPEDTVSNLFAARGPAGESLFGPAITPVNIFPILLDRYLGADLPHQADRNFLSTSGVPLSGGDIPNTDALRP